MEVFDLEGHPKANAAYAWSHDTDDPKNPKRHITVLHIPPKISIEEAKAPRLRQRCEMPQPKSKKAGRPKLPKGAARGKAVQVRFTVDEFKASAEMHPRPAGRNGFRIHPRHVECRYGVRMKFKLRHYLLLISRCAAGDLTPSRC